VIEAVIFDLDGTLVKLPINYEALFDEFKQIIRAPEVHPIVDTVARLDGKTKEMVFTEWERAELAVLGNVTANEEGMNIYRQFRGKRKALVTLQGKKVVKEIMKRHNLTFDFVLTREDSIFRAEQLTSAIGQLKAEPREVLFVGNTDFDAVAAERVGCPFQRVK
jgi:phosphoglycolate phosphatase-like HAD superfamily hydrolase